MLYRVLHPFSRLLRPLFIRDLRVHGTELLAQHGPIILAANHPNSFLDAILLCSLFEHPVTSLTRGDVFRAPWAKRMLHQLHMLPVYRVREGAENLGANYDTFKQCETILRNNGIVLIFSEGLCLNEWHLRKLRKGTARLAFQCWNAGIPVRVVPTAINYSNFRRWGKQVHIHFSNSITLADIPTGISEGVSYQFLNQQLQQALASTVYEAPNQQALNEAGYFLPKPSWRDARYYLLLPFSVTAILLHAPLYALLHYLALGWINDNDHADSILVSVGLLLYPVYWCLLVGLAWLFLPAYTWLLVALLSPLSLRAWLLHRR